MRSDTYIYCGDEAVCACVLVSQCTHKLPVKRPTINFPVKLAAERGKGYMLTVNWVLEFLMLKHQWLKNSPRGNYLVIRAFWFSIMIPGFFLFCLLVLTYFVNFLQGQMNPLATLGDFFSKPNPLNYLNLNGFKKIVLPFLATVSIIYWKLWNDYHSKWTYCCGLFNEILKNSDKPKVSEKLRRALVVDLLVLDLWAHRSFAEFFRDHLEEALRLYYKEDVLAYELEKVNAGNLNECEAQKIIEAYQRSNGTST